MTIDLRSDTVTRPTYRMMEKMATAEVGDDGYGEDRTVNRLEALMAERLGKPAALFVPSGTMANLLATLSHRRAAGEVLAEATCHVLQSEMGGLSHVAGLFPRPLPGRRGAIDLQLLEEHLRSPDISPRKLGTALVCVETSHNAAGGAVLPINHLAAVKALAAAEGVPVHLDGARIFNAAIALGVDAASIARHADTVLVCLSKGLGAPIGSLLCGEAPLILRARAFRKMLGGGMRQAGLMAACGIEALETGIERLAEDHEKARRLARGLHALEPAWVDPAGVETNILRVRLLPEQASRIPWEQRLRVHGVLARLVSRDTLRLVTHRDVSMADMDTAVAAFAVVKAEAEIGQPVDG